MSSALAQEIAADWASDVEAEGLSSTLTFNTFPSRTTNASASTVTPGSNTPVSVEATPPEEDRFELTEDGLARKVEGFKSWFPTKVGTADAITLVPTVGESVAWKSRTYTIAKVEATNLGELILGYWVWMVR